MRGLILMQLMKKNKISFGDFKFVSIVSIVAFIFLYTILKIYIIYFNISGNSNYAYISILRQNYVLDFDDDYFENSKNIFWKDLKDILGINISNPISIIQKEVKIMQSTNIDENELSSNMYANYDDFKEGMTTSICRDRKIKILIYHTHTTEAFKPANNDSFYEQYNIVGIGDVLKKELERNYNIEVVHDKTIHNTTYVESYKRSGETLDRYLTEIDDFDLILDLHRDSLDSKSLVTEKIDGKDTAKVMFVVAKNNPNYLENDELAEDLTNLANDLYPGFARSVFYYERGSNAFNQTKSSKLALIEIGAQLNTVEEAINSAKLLSTVIGEYFVQDQ